MAALAGAGDQVRELCSIAGAADTTALLFYGRECVELLSVLAPAEAKDGRGR